MQTNMTCAGRSMARLVSQRTLQLHRPPSLAHNHVHFPSRSCPNRLQGRHPKFTQHRALSPEVVQDPSTLSSVAGEAISLDSISASWVAQPGFLFPVTLLFQVALPPILAWIVVKLISALANRVQMEALSEQKPLPFFLTSAPLALRDPAKFVFPFAGFLQALLVFLRLTVDYARKKADDIPEWAAGAVFFIRDNSPPMQQFLYRISFVCVTIFVSWVFLTWKDIIVEAWIEKDRRERSDAEDNEGEKPLEGGLEQILLPANAIISWAVMTATAVVGLQMSGVNLQPLLAVGGVGSLVVGLSSQAILSNVISGLSIFISRPFVVGERVTLLQGSDSIVSGIVEDIEPVRTMIRSDRGVPIRLPNKMVAEMIILNESRQVSRPPELSFSLEAKLPLVDTAYDLMAALPAVLSKLQQVDSLRPVVVELRKLKADAVELGIDCNLKPEAAQQGDLTAMAVMLEACRHVRSLGGTIISSVKAPGPAPAPPTATAPAA